MRIISRSKTTVGGDTYDIDVVLTGEKDHPYTAEWRRNGDKQKVPLGINVMNAFEAESLAADEIRKRYATAAPS